MTRATMCKPFTARNAGVLNLVALKGNQDRNASAEEKNVSKRDVMLSRALHALFISLTGSHELIASSCNPAVTHAYEIYCMFLLLGGSDD